MERHFIDVFKLEVVDRSKPMALYRIMKFICDASLVFLSIWRHYVIFPIVCNQDRAIFSRYIEERCLSLFLFISLHRWKISSRMKIHADTENWRDAEIWKILNFKLELYRNFEFFSNFEKRTCNIVNKNCCKSYIFIHENTCI